MVGEGMVVLVDKMEGKVVLEVVDVRRDKVLGEVEVDVAEESTAIVKRQWGNISEEYLEICKKAFPLVPTEAQLLPETPDGPIGRKRGAEGLRHLLGKGPNKAKSSLSSLATTLSTLQQA